MSQHGFDISEVVARLVADLRRREGLTTDELAERAGVHETYIGLVERNARQPTLAAAASLAEALGLSLSDLVAEAEQDVDGGFVPEVELVHAPPRRYAKASAIVESERLTEATWLSGHTIRKAIDAAYRKLDVIDEQMRESGSPSLVELVGLEHLDGLLAGALASGVVKAAPSQYVQNGPRQHPDLLPLQHGLPEMVVRTALETDRPVAGPGLAGIYLVFRYVLVDRKGKYTRGQTSRGDMVAVWEARFGELWETDFIPPRGGKGPTLRKDALDRMELVYYDPVLLPYAKPTGVYSRLRRPLDGARPTQAAERPDNTPPVRELDENVAGTAARPPAGEDTDELAL
jgi:transcriptional regulator with XRE-family HTH domain